MKKLSHTEYEKRKKLKQAAHAIPERETKAPLLVSTVKMKVDPYGVGGMDSMMDLVFPLLIAPILRKRRQPWQ